MRRIGIRSRFSRGNLLIGIDRFLGAPRPIPCRLARIANPAPGGVPEWLKGTGCKPVGYAYVGSNPTSPISPGGKIRPATAPTVNLTAFCPG